jgi:hypothetical protein
MSVSGISDKDNEKRPCKSNPCIIIIIIIITTTSQFNTISRTQTNGPVTRRITRCQKVIRRLGLGSMLLQETTVAEDLGHASELVRRPDGQDGKDDQNTR